MQVELIDRWETLERHRTTWEMLADGHPFLQWTWLRDWWESFGQHRKLAVLRIFDDELSDCGGLESTLGFAPFYVDHNWLQGSVIRFLGSGRACSDHMRLLYRNGVGEKVGEQVGKWLREEGALRHASVRWNLLELDGLVGSDPSIEALVDNLEQHGAIVDEASSLNVWRAELSSNWDAFSKQALKTQYRKKFNKLARIWIESNQASLQRAESPEQASRMLDQLIELHERRRSQIGDDGCFGDPRFVKWMHDVCQSFFLAGNLRLTALDVEGCRVAMALGFEFDGVLYHYQTGIDPDALSMSPGFVLNIAIIQDAMQRGLRAIDFLRGDEHYKSMFGGKPTPCRRLRVVPANAASILRLRLWRAGGSMKKLVSRWR